MNPPSSNDASYSKNTIVEIVYDLSPIPVENEDVGLSNRPPQN